MHVAGLKTTSWGISSAVGPSEDWGFTPVAEEPTRLIGVRKAERHVFESKGRIRRPAQSAISKGARASFGASFGQRHAARDPLRDVLHAEGGGRRREGHRSRRRRDGVEVTFDEWEAVTKAYSFFLDGENVGSGGRDGRGLRRTGVDTEYTSDRQEGAERGRRPGPASAADGDSGGTKSLGFSPIARTSIGSAHG